MNKTEVLEKLDIEIKQATKECIDADNHVKKVNDRRDLLCDELKRVKEGE